MLLIVFVTVFAAVFAANDVFDVSQLEISHPLSYIGERSILNDRGLKVYVRQGSMVGLVDHLFPHTRAFLGYV